MHPGGGHESSPGSIGDRDPARAARAGSAPRPVLRGAKHQVAIDWVRGSMPRSSQVAAERLLSKYFPVAPAESRGRFNLDSSLRWGGASLHFDSAQEAAFCVVDVPGGDLAGLSSAERVDLVVALAGIGMRCTRLDVAVDDHQSPLVDAVQEFCRAGFLRGARRFKLHEGYDGADLDNHGVSIGARGSDGSGRFVRVYRKDLEQETKGPAWCRWETEFSDSCARQVVAAVVVAASDGGSPDRVLLQAAFGAIDFRCGNKHYGRDRDPRLPEWAAYLADVEPVRVTAGRLSSSFDSWAKWLFAAVIPGMIALGSLTGGLAASEVASAAESAAKSSPSWLSSPKAVTVRQALQRGVSGSSAAADLLRALGVHDATLDDYRISVSDALPVWCHQVNPAVPSDLVQAVGPAADRGVAVGVRLTHTSGGVS